MRAGRTFCQNQVEKLVFFSNMDNQRVRILISKGLRADMLLEMSNARQSNPQWADLNLHANLPAIHHAPCSFTTWERAASLAGNQPLQHVTMPLTREKITVRYTYSRTGKIFCRTKVCQAQLPLYFRNIRRSHRL